MWVGALTSTNCLPRTATDQYGRRTVYS